MKWPLHLLALGLFEIRRYLNELSNVLIIKAINTLLLLAEVNVSFYSKLSCRSQNRKTDFNTLVAEEILETMINDRSFSQTIVSKLFGYLDRLQGSNSDIVIIEHATTLGRDPIFVEALTKQANWNVIAPHVYKKNNIHEIL